MSVTTPRNSCISDKGMTASSEPCSTCCKKFLSGEDAICCFLCETWHHIKCVNLAKKHYNAIKDLDTCIEWFCKTCVVNKNLLKNTYHNTDSTYAAASSHLNVESQIYESVEKLKNTFEAKIDKKFADLTSNLLSDISKRINNDKIVPSSKTSYAAVSKKLINHKRAEFSLAGSADTTSSQESTESLTLVISGEIDKAYIRNTSSTIKLFSERFPGLKIVKANVSPTGLIFVTVHDSESANRLLSNWSESLLGTKTKINRYKKKAVANNSVILRNIDTNLLDSEIINHVKSNFPSISSANIFRRQNGQKLPLCKLTFDEESCRSKALKEGVFVDSVFCPAEVFIERRLPRRCFHCQAFGHTSTTCRKSSPVCGKCSDQGHKAQDCSKEIKRCVNCRGAHASFDKSCPVFIDNLAKANFLDVDR